MTTEADPAHPYREAAAKSGYPLQIALEQAVRSSSEQHGWMVCGPEVPTEGGFVDLVLDRHALLAPIECKRLEKGVLLFLVPHDRERSGGLTLERFDAHPPGHTPPAEVIASVEQMRMRETSYESMFCVVPKGSGGFSTLEPVARSLIGSGRELARVKTLDTGEMTLLAPVVVTNAPLVVLKTDPSAVSLDSGRLESGTHEQVPYVRFRKAFDGVPPSGPWNPSPREPIQYAQERTVLVVNASCFIDFLNAFQRLERARAD